MLLADAFCAHRCSLVDVVSDEKNFFNEMKPFEYSRKCHYGTVWFWFFFYNLLRDAISQIRNSKQWKFQCVFLLEWKREEKKYKIRMGLNRTLLAFYETSITRKRITIITSGTRYLFRCKELCKNVCYIALDFKKL